ncbi:MAG: CDP-alcohol phosphatidyltransferase family protein [bacterium]|nr:CDP-alcohol phosphatidyltransferase family protein [bacterium]
MALGSTSMRIVTFPNFLTGLRLLLSPIVPLALFMVWNPWSIIGWDIEYRRGVLFLAFFLALTDFLDGLCAKLFRQESDFGKQLDPIADFVYCCSLFAAVFVIYWHISMMVFTLWAFFGLYFLWYAWAVTRLRHAGRIDKPNRDAKVGMCTLMISLVFVITCSFPWHNNVADMTAIIGGLLAIVMADYAWDAYEKSTHPPPVKHSGANLFPPEQ